MMNKNSFEPLGVELTANLAQPIARGIIEVWDAIQKCTIIRYKDELLKELYKDLSIGISPTMEYGA